MIAYPEPNSIYLRGDYNLSSHPVSRSLRPKPPKPGVAAAVSCPTPPGLASARAFDSLQNSFPKGNCGLVGTTALGSFWVPHFPASENVVLYPERLSQ